MASKKGLEIPLGLDDFTEFDPAVAAAKMPTNITGGKKASTTVIFINIPPHKLFPFMGKNGSDFSRPNEEDMRVTVDTIKELGVLQPVLVRYCADDRYEILAGETRWTGAKMAGLSDVPCLVYQNCDDALARRIFSVTNMIGRKNTTRDLINGWWHYYEGYLMAKNNALETGDSSGVPDLSKAPISSRQIYKYWKVHSLVEQLLVMVDKGAITIDAAELLTALSKEQQLDLVTWNLPASKEQAQQLSKLAKENSWSKETVLAIYIVAAPTGKTEINRQLNNAMKRFRRLIRNKVKPEAMDRLGDIFAIAMQLYFEQHPEDMNTAPARKGDGE